MDDVQKMIDKIKGNQTTTEELLQYLDSKLLLVKANAILAIVRLNKHDNEIIEKLVNVAEKINTDSPVIGNISNSKLAIAALRWLNTKESRSAYDQLFGTFDSYLQEDIEWLVENKPEFNSKW